MRWIMALLAVLATVLVIMPVRTLFPAKRSRFWNLTFKVLPTLICAVFGGAAFFSTGDLYALLIFIGLCAGAVADIMLNIHFITGGALFLAGHLFYMAAFCIQQPPAWYSFAVFAAAFGLLQLFLRYFRTGMSRRMLILVRIYSAALAVVLALALPMPFFAFSQRSLLGALGAVIFVLSDMGVFHGMTCRISRRRDQFYLAIYYLAQLLLGLSAF